MTPEMLIDQWRRGLRISHAAHNEAAKYYQYMNMGLNIPGVVFSTLLSTALFTDFLGKPQLAALSVLTVVVTSLQSALRLSERSERHKSAAVQMGEVRREFEQQIVFEHRDEAVIERLRKKWDAADRQAPSIPSRIYQREAKKVRDSEAARSAATAA
ncbi:SLATT domain-containing protein [Ferriphaselus sp. R-1]|uniref:SLATT domain-containing protein n=1 Tax=Ferriphaselus sp. R-1 TaxID=1485544 RepID=UPI0012690052|nr:SLATT domain-containing protein [Ferriphaselus sp. R-1]